MSLGTTDFNIFIAPTLRILERDYEQTFKEKVNIVYDPYSEQSYNDMSGTIHIGGAICDYNNYYYNEQNFVLSNIYTLAEHEIGHSRFTGTYLLDIMFRQKNRSAECKNILNVLEDARMEHLVSALNVMANFKLTRYHFQDAQLKTLEPAQLIDKTTLCLALYRTIYPERFINFYKVIFGDNAIAELNKRFYRYFYYSEDVVKNYSNATVLYNYFQDFYDYLCEMFEKREQEQQEQEQTQDGSGDSDEEQQDTSDDNSEDTTDDSEEDNADDEDSETDGGDCECKETQGQQEGSDCGQNQNTKSGVKLPELESCSKQEQQESEEMEKLIEKLLQEVEKAVEQFKAEGVHACPIKATDSEYTPMQKIRIDLEHTAFNGKKNAEMQAIKPTMFSSPRNLNKSRYRQNKIMPTVLPKLFDTKSNNSGYKRSKKPVVSFYVDLSGSMSGSRAYYVLDYIRQFYDKMNRYIDINIYSFSTRTLRLTPKHLNNYDFSEIISEYGFCTRLNVDKDYKKSDLNIVLTDGIIHNINSISKDFIDTAMFIVIADDWHYNYSSDFDIYKQMPKDRVSIVFDREISKIASAYEKATKKVSELLRA